MQITNRYFNWGRPLRKSFLIHKIKSFLNYISPLIIIAAIVIFFFLIVLLMKFLGAPWYLNRYEETVFYTILFSIALIQWLLYVRLSEGRVVKGWIPSDDSWQSFFMILGFFGILGAPVIAFIHGFWWSPFVVVLFGTLIGNILIKLLGKYSYIISIGVLIPAILLESLGFAN